MHHDKIQVVIVGGTGFGAGELLRLFINHPYATVTAIVSSSAAKSSVVSAHPHLRGLYDELTFTASIENVAVTVPEKTVFICALPHGQSAKAVALINTTFPQSRIIDLSGDLRLTDKALHTKYYAGSEYIESIREQSVYGLPELFGEKIAKAKVISNPGCLATAAVLSMLPVASIAKNGALKAGVPLVLNLATGSSGAGKTPKDSTHHPVRHANFFSYKPLEHQHEPEIAQTLKAAGLHYDSMAFVPHSLPISRGILCTGYFTLSSDITHKDLITHYRQFFSSAPFVRVLSDSAAEIENVVGSNFCDISLATKGNQAVVTCAIDNLVKGMAGQAIENLNIMFGLDRMSGLRFAGLRPI